ncbi:DNA gyrase subunit A [archaeon]|jgi:DNA gyrase subunit A|nr:DNA gyrase subunit A [archaeon]MBT3451170.1 DNA gyrase subunit A [archaeon]MBT6869704.1 DNA gyrase subunit A [archaeon]MBT7192633.1 DNA gyrase subunit A [archaeon]MBT7380518.1 DNA gyrase subunit A [archaeon]
MEQENNINNQLTENDQPSQHNLSEIDLSETQIEINENELTNHSNDNTENQDPQENDKIIPKLIQDEMKQAYVNYAMSVIVGRALPDVRDGLKPVHRRILFGMHGLGMFHNKPFKKCARIVGEVLGKYHPHGDSAVYDALVRMAQDFSLRYTLIKGQGNFGSIDGDSAAAMRYTEAKLNRIAEELLKDIDKNTVNFRDNFDGSLNEPEVLPSKLPNLLMNGSSGIAVGMATNIPPHNMSEVCDAVMAVIDEPEITVPELMKIVPGPDFPTGGEVYVGNELLAGYTRGRGRVIIQSIVEIEGNKIIVKEIPYQVNKSDLIIQIAELVKDKKIQGIRNINDESDREGIRVVIDLKKDADSQVVLNQLYRHSRLRISYSLNMLALVDNQPKLLSLKNLIVEYVKHRLEVVTRRTEFELKKAEDRLHILDGLLIALSNLDEVIPTIRNSTTVDEAKSLLIQNYSLSEIQAKAILDLKLQKLASLEREKIKSEHQSLNKFVIELNSILGSEERRYQIIKDETLELRNKYGSKRKSKILIGEFDDINSIDMEDLIEETTQVVTLTNGGYLKRLSLDTYRTQNRGGKGIIATSMKDEDFVEDLYVTSTHAYLLIFTDKGQVHWVKVYHIPEASRQSRGKHIANLINLDKEENVSAILAVREFDESYVFMATKKGITKRVHMKDFSRPRKGGIRAVDLAEEDTLIGVKKTSGNNEIILATNKGMANRFNENKVRVMGRTARGVKGIKLNEHDYVVSLLVAEDDKQVLTLSQNGYGKRTNVSEYRLCNRGGKGVTNLKVTEKNGKVVMATIVDGSEDLMLISKNGIGIRVKCDAVSLIGRSTQGVRVMRMKEDDTLAAAAKIINEDDDSLIEKEVSKEEIEIQNKENIKIDLDKDLSDEDNLEDDSALGEEPNEN